MGRKKPTVVASAFIKKDKKYLLVYDPKFEFWRVPGGRVEWGERAEETLIREMKEELDIVVKVEKFLSCGQDEVHHIPKNKNAYRVLLYYECSIESGEVKIIDEKEATDLKWLSWEEIKAHKNLEPAMNDFFTHYEN